jgi:hypothetical protein
MKIGAPTQGATERNFVPLLIMLRGLTDLNAWHYGRGPLHDPVDYPPLYRAGVVYKPEDLGKEDWNDVPVIYTLGEADCEDLACARAGELRAGTGLILRGGIYVQQRHPIAARPCLKWKHLDEDHTLIHILTEWPDGSIEDPSKILGMKGEA